MPPSGRVVWHNGVLVPESEARVSIYDSALMFGDMIFEMTRSFKGVHFKLDGHLDRLFRSAELTHQTVPYTREELHTAIAEVTEANQPTMRPDDEHRLLINVSRGVLGLYAGLVEAPTGPQVMIADFPLRWTTRGMGRLFEDGVTTKRVQMTLPLAKAKHRSRVGYMDATQQASPAWAVCYGENGISEGTGANVFWVQGGVVRTPVWDCLEGISRTYVEQLVDVHHMQAWADLDRMEEAFFTATPFCILPITSFNGNPIGDGKPGPIYRKLLAQWSANVGVDIAAQIRSWDAEPQTQSTGVTPYQFHR